MTDFDICKRCIWPRQCRHYVKCGRITMLTNRFDSALARHDIADAGDIDLKLRKIEEERGCTAAEM
jgi:hypothetical protein